MTGKQLATTGLAWALSLSFLYLMACYSTIIPSQLNGYLSRSQFLPGKSISWSAARNCPVAPSDIMLVLKTGGTETFNRLPVHLETTLRCLEHSLIVSDVEVEIGDHRSVDVLEDLDSETLKHSDFNLYNSERMSRTRHSELSSLVKGQNGWNLDKYKFIPAIRRAWLLGKDTPVDWFVFLEADTAIDMGNLRKLLDELRKEEDPRETMHYIGSSALINDLTFAHGGSGYVISRHLMERIFLARSPEEWLKEWGPRAANECCGDFLLGRMFEEEVNLAVRDARPFFQGANPANAWYAPDLWCHPVVTMHHITPQQVAELWSIGSDGNAVWNRRPRLPLLWKDVFRIFVKPNLQNMRMDWDNGSSNGETLHDIGNFTACKSECQAKEDCYQWHFLNGDCSLASRLMLGEAKKVEAESKHSFSGWMLERIKTFEVNNEDCSPKWAI